VASYAVMTAPQAAPMARIKPLPKAVQDAVDHAMRRLANYLLLGTYCHC